MTVDRGFEVRGARNVCGTGSIRGARLALPVPRLVLCVLLAGAITAVSAPAAQAGFGVSSWEAGTCVNTSCTYASVEKNHGEAFTQAAGHPPYGLTSFEFNHRSVGLGQEPEGRVKRIRVDIPPGLAANPEALPKCPIEDFRHDKCPKSTEVGTNELTVFVGATNTEVTGTVYSLEQPPGLPLDFGIHVEIPLVSLVANEHIYLEGHVDWSGDYHEYFEINAIPNKIPLLKSKLNFKGRAGNGNFLTLPSKCSPNTTSYLEIESYEGVVLKGIPTTTPVGVEGCDKVPFQPLVELLPENAGSDQPDGATAEVKVPQKAGPEEINTADVKDVHVVLPEGMTLNPSAAHGLGVCTAAQIGIGTTAPVTCPPAARIGTVTIETDLPPGSLAGNVYLGSPTDAAIEGPPFTIYIDAESIYGVSVRLQGQVNLNPTTGRVEATFVNNPQLPFSDLIMKLTPGALAPLANPLTCGTAQVQTLFTPFTEQAAALSSRPFMTTGCPNPLPFALTQNTQSSTPGAGAHTSYTFNLARADGQQYLAQVKTTLPPGLVGEIPSVPLCGEPQANGGACGAQSQIGTATVTAGAGPQPYAFTGPVFLTGPYNSAPYGLSIVVPAIAGPFNFGSVVTRVGLTVDPYTARVTATSSVPTIVKGVPLRLKSVSVAVNRPNFLLNPTSCAPLATETTLTSTFGALQGLASPFQVANCGALAFKPSFTASSNAKTSKAGGASLHVTVTQGVGQANIRSVSTTLPVQLPARLTTLQKACGEATFAANPHACPAGSKVGEATVTTPVLPGLLKGPAYLVSHGGAAFPDLDLVLEGDGVRAILVGNTNIKNSITSSTFAAIPDVPVTRFELDLPTGPNSALTANGSLCAHPLVMPTTIVAQSGARIQQNTAISVAGCHAAKARRRGVRILRRRIVGHTLVLVVRTPGPGRITAGGRYLKTVKKRLRKASTTTLRVPLSRGGLKALHKLKTQHRHRPLKVRVRVSFKPTQRGAPSSAASTAVKFRH
jgi:hypothetical protein